jgi:hypothetical protein
LKIDIEAAETALEGIRRALDEVKYDRRYNITGRYAIAREEAVKKAWQRLNTVMWPLVDMGREHIVTGKSTLK